MILKLILAVSLVFMAGPAWAATQTMSACTQAAFNMAYTAAANGDTIAFPAGTCGITWSGTTDIAKTSITIQGDSGNTTITSTAPVFKTTGTTANNLTVKNIIFSNTASAQPSLLFWYTGSNPYVGTKNIRVTGCTFNMGNCSECNAMQFFGEVSGVVDANTFNEGPIYSSMVHVMGGDSSSATFPFTLGDANAIYFEGNTINDTGGMGHFIASRMGSRYVVRYNTFNVISWNVIDAHDQYEGQTSRGSFTTEIYENRFIYPSGYGARVINLRGGQHAVYNNFFNRNCDGCINLTSYMVCDGGKTPPQPDQINATYVWGNKRNCGADMDSCTNGTTLTSGWGNGFTNACTAALTENTDFWLSAMPAYTAYVYPHELTNTAADETAPTISGLTPSGNIAYQTTSQLSATTDENATCRIHASSTTWAEMSEMASTGYLTHTQTVNVSVDANSFKIVCQDPSANESTAGTWSFTVAAQDVPPATAGTATRGAGGTITRGAGGTITH